MEGEAGIVKSKCPKCGGEVKEGYIYSSKGVISWTPKNEKPPFFIWQSSEHGIKLGKFSFWSLEKLKVSAMNCERCKMVLIQYGENND